MNKYLLSFFFVISFSICAYSQNEVTTLQFEKTTFTDVKLTTKFHKFDLWKLISNTSVANKSNELKLKFGDSIISFTVEHNNNLIKSDFVITANGKHFSKDASLVHLNTKKGAENECRISLAKDFILGSFTIGKEKYIIEQARNFIKDTEKDFVIIYNEKVEIKVDVKCGTETVSNAKNVNNLSSNSNQVLNGICRVIDYAIAVDYSSFQNHGSSINQTSNYILSIMNMVEGNYVGVFTDDLFYKISEIVIFTSPQVNPWLFTHDINTNLSSFTGWATTGFTKPFDDASYWFNSGSWSGTVGLAWLNTTCQANGYNTNAIREFGVGVNTMRCLISHEIGHNFGCAHTTGFIMNPSVNNATTWAPESITTVNNRIAGTGGTCITPCSYIPCEKLQAENVAVADNGSQLIVSWNANTNPVKVEYRQSTSGPFSLVGTFNSPINSTSITHNSNCGVTEYFQVRVTPICPNTNTGVPLIIVKQSIGGIPPTPTISITANSTIFCGGTNATFNAAITSGGTSPIYQWKVNGINVSTNVSSYSTTTLNHNDIVTCVLTSSISCVTSNNIVSNAITIALNPPISNFNFTKVGLAVNFSNSSTCAASYSWNFGDGSTSTSANPTHTYATNGIYNVCLTVTNVNGSNQKCLQIPVFNAWVDNMNDATNGIGQAITFQNSLCDRASEFKINSTSNPQLNPSIEYPFDLWIPKKGTIEFLCRITGGYGSFGISPNSGTLFQIGSGFLGGQVIRKLEVTSGGTINFLGTVGGNYSNLQALGTPFRFNEWHVVSISYGTQGYKIAVNGIIRASNTVQITGLDSARVQLGEIWYPSNTRWEGITGLVDKVRFSYAESDFVLSLPTLPPTATILTSTNNICFGTPVTFTATTNAPTANYQWKKNGVNVGGNSPTYVDNGLLNGNLINCVVTATSGCFGTPTNTSNTINMVVNTPVAPVSTITASANNICPGTSVTFTATTNASIANYQWKKNGVNVGTNTNTFTDNTLLNNDQITCFVSATSGCFSTTATAANTITISVVVPVTPSISITASRTNPCVGENVIFTATSTNSGATPTYQWKRNGINVGNGITYSTTTLVNSDIISCVLTSSLICVTSTTANSNSINITVRPIITPAASIATIATTICQNSNITFTALTNIINPIYQWKVNNINTATNNDTFTSSSLNNNDVVSCTITAPALDCYSTYITNSNNISITVRPLLTPTITIISNDVDNILCEGQLITFIATSTNGGSAPVYQWKKNGLNVGSNSATFNLATPSNNDEVSCIITSNENCLTSNNIESNKVKIEVVQVNPTITKNGFTITVTPQRIGAAWQWYKDGQIIAGATNATFDASIFGNYTVKETFKTCTKYSTAVAILPFTNNNEDDIKIYPNPANELLFAQSRTTDITIKSVTIFDETGKRILSQSLPNTNLVKVNLSTLSNSVYIAVFETNGKTVRTKFIKQ
ncbi:MAG: PKD domain-containing protein [Ferruginibacter sp.]